MTTKHGTETTMDTAKIGRKAAIPVPPSAPDPKFTDADNPFATKVEPVVAVEEPKPAPIAQPAEPWSEYNARVSVARTAIEAAQLAMLSIGEIEGTAGVFGHWVDPKQWKNFFGSALTTLDTHVVVGFATKKQMAALPDGQNFLYALDAKSKRGAA